MNNSTQEYCLVKPSEGVKMPVFGLEITTKIASALTNGSYYVFESLVPPQSGVPPHTHALEDEILKIIDGDFEIFLDGKTFKATSGAVAYFPRGIVHGFLNCGSKPALTMFMVSPGENFERFFEELSVLPSDLPPDMEKVREIFDRYQIRLEI